MSIVFRRRHDHSVMDSSYPVFDGSDGLLKGDRVSVLFPVTPEEAKVINDENGRDFLNEDAVRASSMGSKDWMVHIPCLVVERRHGMSFVRNPTYGPGLQRLSTSITLECVSGRWEDVLEWVVFGKVPKWAQAETDEEKTDSDWNGAEA